MSGSLIVCIENRSPHPRRLKTLLTAGGAEVIAVLDAEGAMSAIEAAGGRVTGVLVDYHLDRGNNVAAIREIRRRFGDRHPGNPDHRRPQPRRCAPPRARKTSRC